MLTKTFITTLLKAVKEVAIIEKSVRQADQIAYGREEREEIEEITPAYIAKVLWKEEKEEELQRLNKDFYARCATLIKKMEHEIASRSSFSHSKNLVLIKSNLLDLIKYRTQKIIKLAMVSHFPQDDLINRMTWEEELLYIILCKILSSWDQFIVNEIVGR
ncbi:MAG: hypothetical protein DRJ52_02015 [Thermoprotei archaeon]|nr:MAG: hypothetical protein DRJ52_02015 [Thermoprotei archaeon]RLE98840.1 MAG: hypothetical protein DRJ63_07060 [Thermoprotei archaeon]